MSSTPQHQMLPRPAGGDQRLGSMAPVRGVVPGATGEAAVALAGEAGERFAELNDGRLGSAPVQSPATTAAAQLHTDWGIYPPVNASTGMMATQSILPDQPVAGGDFLYAPTAKSSGHSCIELTTAYHSGGAVLWAWDWCVSQSPGKTVRMDAAFRATYTTTVNGRPAYTMSETRTDAGRNTWTVDLYNYKTQAWDLFWSQSGTDQASSWPFGWNTFEVYTSVNPSTQHGYFCDATRNAAIESSNIQLYVGNSWTPATAAAAPLSSPPPSGSSFQCPSLTFSVVTPNSDWLATNQ